ncbi:MAG: hypothetical protein M1819_003642 [Sarea resinae]|nr:MAG: hypothetical protein M1819_003642 [Sarea resinae]
MAPTKGKRSSIRDRAARSGSGALPQPRPSLNAVDTGFGSSKKDKRTIKHSSFVSKIEKGNGKTKKRRRPSKKLITDLESLVDALPDHEAEDGDGHVVGDARIRHKSLKSRPGAMKRKEKLEKQERERFGKNMAQLVDTKAVVPAPDAAMSAPAAEGGATASRWAALRGFISQTMEQKPEFINR